MNIAIHHSEMIQSYVIIRFELRHFYLNGTFFSAFRVQIAVCQKLRYRKR